MNNVLVFYAGLLLKQLNKYKVLVAIEIKIKWKRKIFSIIPKAQFFLHKIFTIEKKLQ